MATIDGCLAQQFICLRPGYTIEEILLKQFDEHVALLEKEQIEPFPALSAMSKGLRRIETAEERRKDTEEVAGAVAPLLSLVLYLCADDKEIENLDGAEKSSCLVRAEPLRPVERPGPTGSWGHA